METIIEKLKNVNDQNQNQNPWKGWSLKEKKQLLEIYYLFSKKEAHIYDLIYSYHGCDSWEDIFRDYSRSLLRDKAEGVEIAIEAIDEQIKRELERDE
jgi:hypothetical protein